MLVNKITRKMNKYRNIKTVVDGIKFDSKKEATRYIELKLMQEHSLISNMERQPVFDIVINQKKIATYKADFRYFDISKQMWIIEDVKSKATKTPVYRLKKKILENQEQPVYITEV